MLPADKSQLKLYISLVGACTQLDSVTLCVSSQLLRSSNIFHLLCVLVAEIWKIPIVGTCVKVDWAGLGVGNGGNEKAR